MAAALESNDQKLLAYLGEVPNAGAAIFALTAYLAVSLALMAVTIRTRGWFMLTAVFTGFLEFGGFLSRLLMLQSATAGTTIAMQCLLIISPVLLNIVEYVCVGKLIRLSGESKASHWLRWQAPLFTASDILTLALQGAGGGMLSMAQAGDLTAAERGRQLLLVGLALQLGFFTLFTLLTIYVQHAPRFGYRCSVQHHRLFVCLYITIALLFVRNIFRVIEFAQGWKGYLATHEVYFYIFDFIPIFLTLVFFTIWHYGWYLHPRQPEVPSKDSNPYLTTSHPAAPGTSPASAPPASAAAKGEPQPGSGRSSSFVTSSSSVEDGQAVVELGVVGSGKGVENKSVGEGTANPAARPDLVPGGTAHPLEAVAVHNPERL